VNLDPKLLIAGLCVLAISFALALIQKQLRQRRLQGAIAPRPQAMAGAGFLADVDDSKARLSGAKTIVIVHDFDNPAGYENHRREYLSSREGFEVLAEIRSVDKSTPINIVLHTPGGDRFAGEMIANALKDRPNTTAYVPYCAMSAGTMIALATEKVVMGRYASLGPTDAQFGGFPADTFARLV
jgi:ClpP class serine protease